MKKFLLGLLFVLIVLLGISTNSYGQASQPGFTPPIVPDRRMSPGDILPVTAEDICVKGYSKKVRNVPQSLKEQVYQNYGITSREPKEYEIDHIISLELGGSNSIKNLFPESYRTMPYNAHVKDKLENRLHYLVCHNQLSLRTAQRAIRTDWIAAYKKYVEAQPTTLIERAALKNKKNHDFIADVTGSGEVIANKNTHIYHLPGCPSYNKIAVQNQIRFSSVKEAEKKGYRLARNCRQ